MSGKTHLKTLPTVQTKERVSSQLIYPPPNKDLKDKTK